MAPCQLRVGGTDRPGNRSRRCADRAAPGQRRRARKRRAALDRGPFRDAGRVAGGALPDLDHGWVATTSCLMTALGAFADRSPVGSSVDRRLDGRLFLSWAHRRVLDPRRRRRSPADRGRTIPGLAQDGLAQLNAILDSIRIEPEHSPRNRPQGCTASVSREVYAQGSLRAAY